MINKTKSKHYKLVVRSVPERYNFYQVFWHLITTPHRPSLDVLVGAHYDDYDGEIWEWTYDEHFLICHCKHFSHWRYLSNSYTLFTIDITCLLINKIINQTGAKHNTLLQQDQLLYPLGWSRKNWRSVGAVAPKKSRCHSH